MFKKWKEKRLNKKQNIENREKERILKLKKEYSILQERIEIFRTKQNEEGRHRSRRRNSTCPKCKMNQVNDSFKNITGNLNGSISGSSGIFFGDMYGRIKGEVKTSAVNKCVYCHHEWLKDDYNFMSKNDCEERLVNIFFWYLESWKDIYIYIITFDPNDMKEKYNSLEEKRDSIKRQTTWDKDLQYFFNGLCIEFVIKYITESQTFSRRISNRSKQLLTYSFLKILREVGVIYE